MLKLTKAYNREGFLLNTYYNPGADYVIEDITELPEVIAKINESL